jgi:hypothetical protein
MSGFGPQPTYRNVCLCGYFQEQSRHRSIVEETIFLLSPDPIWFNG